MLKILRKKGVMKKILWFLAVVIILAFGFLGQAYRLGNSRMASYAGKIFGRTVSLEEFQKNYQQTQIQAFMQYGRNLDKIRDIINLEAETWDRIIALQDAHKRHIKINDEEVLTTLLNYPLFQRNGKFDKELYNTTLRYAFKISPQEFEEGLRDSLKLVHLYKQVTSDVKVSKEEIFRRFKKENEKVQVSYILFPIEKYKSQVPYDEEAIEAYYQKNKTSFIQPPQINVAYIQLDIPPDATEEQKQNIEDKALDVYHELSQNPNLDEIAKKNNLEIKTTGFFSVEKPILKEGWSFPLIQKLFQFKIGQISDLLETEQGFQILSLKGKKDATIPEFSAVKDSVEEAWKEKQALEISKQTALKYLDNLRQNFPQMKNNDFIQLAKAENLEIYQTPLFARGQYLPTVGISKDFQDAAFSLDESNKISNVIQTTKGYCILSLDSKQPADLDEFQKQKSALAEKILAEKRAEAFNDYIAQLRIKAKLEDRIPELLSKDQAS